MAYPHQKVEYLLTTSAGDFRLLCSATGSRGRLWLGKQAYVIRAVGFAPTSTTAIKTKVKFSLRLVTGGNGKASVSGDQFTTLTMATGALQGKWRVRDNLQKKLLPGQELDIVVTTKATQADAVRGIAYIEPSWETAANLTAITTVTA